MSSVNGTLELPLAPKRNLFATMQTAVKTKAKEIQSETEK
jgi:hypothetical protein